MASGGDAGDAAPQQDASATDAGGDSPSLDAAQDAPRATESGVDAATDAGFDPTWPNGLALWLRADRGVTSSFGLVSKWSDISGIVDATHEFSAPGPAPTLLVADPSTGKPSVKFDATDPTVGNGQQLVSTQFSTALQPPLTFYAVARSGPSSTEADSTMYVFDAAAAGDRYAIVFTSGTIIFYAQAASGNVRGLTYNGDQRGKATIVSAVVNGSQSGLFVNSLKAAAPNGIGTLDAVPLRGLTIGAGMGGAGQLLGTVSEIVIYQGAHDDTTRARVMGYLSTRYGIPLQ